MRELSPAPVGVSINETTTSDMRDTGGETADPDAPFAPLPDGYRARPLDALGLYVKAGMEVRDSWRTSASRCVGP